ncbi:hypothetical protein AZE42_09310 [Rhizopogon vesiculosus]|uniref:DUF6533 domain-containing protein n=1 Tax=Rhizopogon vesiculosus TaxID=180088 RepID=A0A1J8PR48_9AGAM|nr:hypothetical protein AZE42_09310 [Rhizopogon vesiculosus]
MSLPVSFAAAIWVRTTFSSAGFTLLVYDYVLTLRDEVTYIWNAPWTVVKVMFFINRYGNLAGQTFISLEESGLLTDNSQSFCRKFALITTIFMLLSSESIHIHFQYLDVARVCVGRMPISENIQGNSGFSTHLVSSMYSFEMDRIFRRQPSFFIDGLLSTDANNTQSPKYLLAKGFANPLLSVAGQRLVLNLRGLKTRTYETRDLSCEVDRQIQAAFGNVTALDNDDPEIEQGRGCAN